MAFRLIGLSAAAKLEKQAEEHYMTPEPKPVTPAPHRRCWILGSLVITSPEIAPKCQSNPQCAMLNPY